jgi:hypothetical protein
MLKKEEPGRAEKTRSVGQIAGAFYLRDVESSTSQG